MSRSVYKLDVNLLRFLLSSFILGIGLLTIVGFSIARHEVITEQNNRFTEYTKAITEDITRNISQTIDTLYLARSFVLVNRTPSQSDWETFLLTQRIFDGSSSATAISLARYNKSMSRSQFANQLSAQHNTSIKITPYNNDYTGLAPIVVVASNIPGMGEQAVGYNILSDPTRRKAVLAARTTRDIQISEPLKLFPSGNQGFIAVLPIYVENNRLYGFINGVFRSENLLERLTSPSKIEDIAVTIRDEKAPETALYTSKLSTENRPLTRSDTIEVGGRQWKITYHAPKGKFSSSLLSFTPMAILIIGSAFMILSIFVANSIMRLLRVKSENVHE